MEPAGASRSTSSSDLLTAGLLHPAWGSFLLLRTERVPQRGASTYSPCLPLWSLLSSGFLVWGTAQTLSSPLSSPLPVEDIREMRVLPPWRMGSRYRKGSASGPWAGDGPSKAFIRHPTCAWEASSPVPPVPGVLLLPTAHLPPTSPFSCPGPWGSSLSVSCLSCPSVQNC